ncbi:hypothetical protein [Streptomyces sp. MP131-18]|uniref:hypothetical protein n=1 Tax=Streptomyces sp. MP131-18 TaxID=1857892 RepID=UPI00097BC860|nr:hypothetical protein [Streptomyces sp. MP131-18]ONK13105.1 hypothetical protein STBA_38670 [Streptomyces sp. MP131-18]
MLYVMRCPCCGDPLAVTEEQRHTATSLLIDPETGLPPDVDPETGAQVKPHPEAVRRSKRRPICASCLEQFIFEGHVTWKVRLPGEPEAIGHAWGEPLTDASGKPLATQCPFPACSKVVEVINGRIEKHTMTPSLSDVCPCSEAMVVFSDPA